MEITQICPVMRNFLEHTIDSCDGYPDNKVYGALMGPTWGRQDPGGPDVGPIKIVIWVGAKQATNHYLKHCNWCDMSSLGYNGLMKVVSCNFDFTDNNYQEKFI